MDKSLVFSFLFASTRLYIPHSFLSFHMVLHSLFPAHRCSSSHISILTLTASLLLNHHKLSYTQISYLCENKANQYIVFMSTIKTATFSTTTRKVSGSVHFLHIYFNELAYTGRAASFLQILHSFTISHIHVPGVLINSD